VFTVSTDKDILAGSGENVNLFVLEKFAFAEVSSLVGTDPEVTRWQSIEYL